MVLLCIQRDKSVKVFLSGDFEFLCRSHGISGASGKNTLIKRCTVGSHVFTMLGRHPCLWCHVRRDQLAIPPEKRGAAAQLRSLQTLQQNYTSFTTVGRGNLQKAKQHYNVIGKSFFPIPLDQVKVEYMTFTQTFMTVSL